MRSSFLLFVTLISLLVAQGVVHGREEPVPIVIECVAHYRASVTVGIEERASLLLSKHMQHEKALFEDLEFHAHFNDDPYEGRSLRVTVSQRGSTSSLVTHLYQLRTDAPPVSQFSGGHGFSGLIYVYHPTSGAELQFICKARPKER